MSVQKQQKDSNLLVKMEPLQTVLAQLMGIFSGFGFQSKAKSETFALIFQATTSAMESMFKQFVITCVVLLTWLLQQPGSTGDNDACKECSLYHLIDNLPEAYVVIGDAAYGATENLISLYYGQNRRKALYDNFNYYGSQCHIRIEMTFGMMQTKWGILDRTIPLSVKQTGKVICAIARLHNFVINERLDIVSEAPTKLVYWPSQPENANGDPIDDEGNVITIP